MLDFAIKCLFIKPFRIASDAHIQWRINEKFVECMRLSYRSSYTPLFREWRYERDDNN